MKISDIVINPAVAIRYGLDEDTVQRYCEIFEFLPPVVVFEINSSYVLSDGFHRREAAVKNGLQAIEVEIKRGTLTDAAEYAITANLKHGRPLTRDEYKHAVRKLRNLYPNWGRRKIAKVVGRSEGFVMTVLKSDEVRQGGGIPPLEDSKLEEIAYAPKDAQKLLAEASHQQSLTTEQIKDKVRQIKAHPEHINEILTPAPEILPPPVVEVPGDKILSLIHQVNDLANKLSTNQYDFIGGYSLIGHVIDSLNVLADKAKDMMHDLEELQRR